MVRYHFFVKAGAMVDAGRIFADRENAGVELGKLLEAKYRDRHAIVMGIPRGGVEVAYHVAKKLHGDLTCWSLKSSLFRDTKS